MLELGLNAAAVEDAGPPDAPPAWRGPLVPEGPSPSWLLTGAGMSVGERHPAVFGSAPEGN